MNNNEQINNIITFSEAIEAAIRNSTPKKPLTPEIVERIQTKLNITYAPAIIEAMVNATMRSLNPDTEPDKLPNFIIPRKNNETGHATSKQLADLLKGVDRTNWADIIHSFPLEGDYTLRLTD